MFNIELSPATENVTTDLEPEFYDEYEPLTIEACSLLEETDCQFHVSGFGEVWPVDVGYDLSTFMEGFPELLHALRAGSPGKVDFYGQGIERTLTFRSHGDHVEVVCESRTSWAPDPPTEHICRDVLESMLVTIAINFGTSLELVCPRMAAQEPYDSWRQGIV